MHVKGGEKVDPKSSHHKEKTSISFSFCIYAVHLNLICQLYPIKWRGGEKRKMHAQMDRVQKSKNKIKSMSDEE